MRIEGDKGGLLGDVYQWVLINEDFIRWRRDEQNTLLWVKGDPGKGKTMLLYGIINELEKDCSNVSYFFYQATDDRINSATAVLRGLIYARRLAAISSPSYTEKIQPRRRKLIQTSMPGSPSARSS